MAPPHSQAPLCDRQSQGRVVLAAQRHPTSWPSRESMAMDKDVNHRWSGWPGAWCLDCGVEDARELAAAGPVKRIRHRYSKLPHTEQPCLGCSDGPCEEPGSKRHDP